MSPSIGCLITSPSKIANVMNKFFVDKIRKIEWDFEVPDIDPIEIFRKFVKKLVSRFEIPLNQTRRMSQIYQQAKIINALGMDNIRSKLIKLIQNYVNADDSLD